MNALENWFCSSSLWRFLTESRLLPWFLDGSRLGDHVLELGSGPGAATASLRAKSPRVTSLDYSPTFAATLSRRLKNSCSSVLCADASILPFPDQTFSSAVAILMLHHLPTAQRQNFCLEEVHRVLKPGGVFIAFEIPDSRLNRLLHTKSTFTPLSGASAFPRFSLAGFSRVAVDFKPGAFRIRATRARDAT